MKKKFKQKYKEKIIEASFADLSNKEIKQLLKYLWIYKNNHCTEHYEVNEIITKEDRWDDFTMIRSLNDHGYRHKVLGIEPKYFAIICKVLKIEGADGNPLEDWEKY
jgi:hypothetical protein